MRPPFFFVQDQISNALGERSSFFYRSFAIGKEYPIALQLQSTEIGVYLVHPYSRRQVPLFRLPFSDHREIDGKLTRELNQLALVKGYVDTELISKSVSSERYFDWVKQLDKKLPQQNRISLPLLVLDFLFDLQHSDIFQHSPHYDRLRTIIRENLLFQAILAKAEYLYQRGLYQAELERVEKALVEWEENQGASKGIPQPHISSITHDYYQAAEKKWLQLLIDEESGPVIAASPWFADNLEEEVRRVLWPNEIKESLSEAKSVKDPILRRVWDRANQRFQYWKPGYPRGISCAF